MITTALLIVALVCLLLQALQVNIKHIEIGWLGLFFWCLAVTLPQLHLMWLLVALLLVLIIVIIIRTR